MVLRYKVEINHPKMKAPPLRLRSHCNVLFGEGAFIFRMVYLISTYNINKNT